MGISRSAERGNVLRRPRRGGQKEGTPSRGSSLLRLPLPPCSYLRATGRAAPLFPSVSASKRRRVSGHVNAATRADTADCTLYAACWISNGCANRLPFWPPLLSRSAEVMGRNAKRSGRRGKNQGGNGSSKRVKTPGGGVHPFCPRAGQARFSRAPQSAKFLRRRDQASKKTAYRRSFSLFLMLCRPTYPAAAPARSRRTSARSRGSRARSSSGRAESTPR